MQNTYGYYHGRFQPFHNGHLAVVMQALSEVPELVIGISNPFRSSPSPEAYFDADDAALRSLAEARDPASNPFPLWGRALMIREGLRTSGVDLSRVTLLPNLANTGLPISEARIPKELTIVFLTPKGEHNRAALETYQQDGWRVRTLPLAADSVGASQIRQRIRHGEDWEQLVPAGTAEVIRWLLERGMARL